MQRTSERTGTYCEFARPKMDRLPLLLNSVLLFDSGEVGLRLNCPLVWLMLMLPVPFQRSPRTLPPRPIAPAGCLLEPEVGPGLKLPMCVESAIGGVLSVRLSPPPPAIGDGIRERFALRRASLAAVAAAATGVTGAFISPRPSRENIATHRRTHTRAHVRTHALTHNSQSRTLTSSGTARRATRSLVSATLFLLLHQGLLGLLRLLAPTPLHSVHSSREKGRTDVEIARNRGGTEQATEKGTLGGGCSPWLAFPSTRRTVRVARGTSFWPRMECRRKARVVRVE